MSTLHVVAPDGYHVFRITMDMARSPRLGTPIAVALYMYESPSRNRAISTASIARSRPIINRNLPTYSLVVTFHLPHPAVRNAAAVRHTGSTRPGRMTAVEH